MSLKITGAGPRVKFNSLNKGLIGHWPLDQLHKVGSLYADISAQGNHGTPVATPTATTDRMGAANKALAFNGTTQYVDIGNIGKTMNSIGFWVYPDSVTKSIIDLDGGTHTITVAGGTIAANGFATPTIYVNGVASSTLVISQWQYVFITTATGFTVSDMDVARVAAAYFDGKMHDIRLFDYVKTLAEMTALYNSYGGNLNFV